MSRSTLCLRATTVSAVLTVAAMPVVHAAADSGPIIDGLAGPLGLAVGDDGTIYVAEAFGGRLTSVDHNGTKTVLVDAPGEEIAGVDARGKGTTVFTQTLFDGNAGEEAPPLDSLLARVQPNGRTRQIASTQTYEVAANPDAINTYGLVNPSDECLSQVGPVLGAGTYSGIVESHPYAVAIVPGGYAIADAAGNSVLRVGKSGQVSTVAVLPPVEQTITSDAVAQLAEEGIDVSECEGEQFRGEPVPTDVEVGPDGAWYVSSLPGFPEEFGAGSVWRVDPASGATTMVATGFAGAVDIAVDRDGSIIVAELFAYQISRVRNGTVEASVFADSPGAVEIGRDGTVYAAVGVFTDSGSVVTVDI